MYLLLNSNFTRTLLILHLSPCSLEELLRDYPASETSHPLHTMLAGWCGTGALRYSLFAKISDETPANLLDREFRSSSTAAVTSARASSEGFDKERVSGAVETIHEGLAAQLKRSQCDITQNESRCGCLNRGRIKHTFSVLLLTVGSGCGSLLAIMILG